MVLRDGGSVGFVGGTYGSLKLTRRSGTCRHRNGWKMVTAGEMDHATKLKPTGLKLPSVNFLEMVRALVDHSGRPDKAIDDLSRKYGDNFMADLGLYKFAVLTAPDDVRKVLSAPESEISNANSVDIAMRMLLELEEREALIDDPFMPRVREGLSKTTYLRQHIRTVNASIAEEIERVVDPEGEYCFEKDASAAVSRVVLYSAMRTMLGEEFTQKNGKRLADIQVEWEHTASRPLFLLSSNLPLPWVKSVHELAKEGMALVEEEILRRANLSEGPHSETTKFSDYLDFVQSQVDADDFRTNRFTRIQIAYHIFVLIFAAHFTTSFSTMTVAHRMGTNRDLLFAVRREAENVDLDALTTYRPGAVPYMEAIWNEANRLTLTSGAFRVVAKPGGLILGDYHIPEGTCLNVVPHTLNRVESVYPNPEVFDAERWIGKGNLEAERVARGEYYKFGIGTHQCYGRKLAEVIVKSFNLHLASKYDVKMISSEEEYFNVESRFGLYVPKHPVKFQVTVRQ